MGTPVQALWRATEPPTLRRFVPDFCAVLQQQLEAQKSGNPNFVSPNLDCVLPLLEPYLALSIGQQLTAAAATSSLSLALAEAVPSIQVAGLHVDPQSRM